MKQNITIEQLNELGEKGKERLREWWKPKEFDLYISRYGYEVNGWEVDNDGCVSFDEENKLDKVNDGDSKWEKCYPLLSIGQMVEFLDENKIMLQFDNYGRKYENEKDVKHFHIGFNEQLCDNLWLAVKEVLEK